MPAIWRMCGWTSSEEVFFRQRCSLWSSLLILNLRSWAMAFQINPSRFSDQLLTGSLAKRCFVSLQLQKLIADWCCFIWWMMFFKTAARREKSSAMHLRRFLKRLWFFWGSCKWIVCVLNHHIIRMFNAGARKIILGLNFLKNFLSDRSVFWNFIGNGEIRVSYHVLKRSPYIKFAVGESLGCLWV